MHFLNCLLFGFFNIGRIINFCFLFMYLSFCIHFSSKYLLLMLFEETIFVVMYYYSLFIILFLYYKLYHIIRKNALSIQLSIWNSSMASKLNWDSNFSISIKKNSIFVNNFFKVVFDTKLLVLEKCINFWYFFIYFVGSR